MWAITVPDAANSTSRPSCAVAPSFRVTVSPVQSVICDATTRCQISSYARASDWGTSWATSAGSRNVSPAGRIASWASCAFFDFVA